LAVKRYDSTEMEGGGIARLTQAIAMVGYNKDLRIETGTVNQAPPSLEIELDDGIVLEADDVTIAQHITQYKLKINGVDATIDNALKVGDRVLLISDDETDQYFVIDRVVTYDVSE